MNYQDFDWVQAEMLKAEENTDPPLKKKVPGDVTVAITTEINETYKAPQKIILIATVSENPAQINQFVDWLYNNLNRARIDSLRIDSRTVSFERNAIIKVIYEANTVIME